MTALYDITPFIAEADRAHILAELYARGELDTEEYRERLSELRSR